MRCYFLLILLIILLSILFVFVDGGINYRRLIDSNSEINIFEIISPDCFSIEIDNRELNIEVGGPPDGEYTQELKEIMEVLA